MSENFYDAIIIGGGPAGLSSAIYMARAKYKTLVLEKEKFGGQITITSEVVNYPGVFHTSGEKLTKEMQKQGEAFGAEFVMANVEKIEKDMDFYNVKTNKGSFKTLGIIIASGASPRMIGFSGEETYKGRGVAYCATCDGEFFTGKEIFVIGGGFAACEEALFLTRFASKIYMVVRRDKFSCTGNVVDEVIGHEKIEILYNTNVNKVYGENYLQGISLNKNEENIEFFEKNGIGVFVFAGYVPASEKFKDVIEVNDENYIITDKNKKTNLNGIYAAGDICVKELRQVVTAVSDGATAATSLEKYIANKYESLNLPKRIVEKKEVKKTEPANNNFDDGAFISKEIKEELMPIFQRFEKNIILKYSIDEREVSKEVEGFMKEMSTLTSKITCVKEEPKENVTLPVISIFNEENKSCGVSFHGVPGGHEFNSFIIGLYNAAGPGQKISDEDLKRIKNINIDSGSINNKINIDLAVTLSCTNCPELVISAQRIALENENVTLNIYELSHFEELKEKHNIMSVPCMIINEEHVHFGKKGITEILEILEKI